MNAKERRAQKDAEKLAAAKPAVDPAAEAAEKAQYEADLKADADADAEKAEAAEKKVKELRGAGAAMKEAELKKSTEEVAALVKDTEIVAGEAAKVLEDAAKLATDSVNLAADAQALVEETIQLATSHPDMCDPEIFGHYDADNKICKGCMNDFMDCALACKALTEHNVTLKPTTKPAKAAGSSTRQASTRGGSKVILCSAESATGRMELMLCRPEGASKEEMRTLRGAVESHLNSLKKAGYVIECVDKRYYYRPAAPVVAQKA